MSKVQIGKNGEELARKYLEKLGYQIITQNYRIRGGEIDLIAKDGGYLVFVEVKTRYTYQYGKPCESMTPWKIQYLLRTARYYLQKINWGNKPYRLDFIAVDFTSSPDQAKIELIRNITG